MHRTPSLARGALLLLAGVLGHCSSPTSSPSPDVVTSAVDAVTPGADAGESRPDATTAVDVATDRGRPMREPQPIYGPCRSDTECQEGLSCRTEAETGIPGGQCNRECSRDDDCVLPDPLAPADGYCTPATAANPRRLCQRVCVNGIDCERPGFTCALINQQLMLRVCIPVCTPESCIDGNACNPATNRCQRPGTTPVGAGFGEGCRANNDPMITDETRCGSNVCQAETVPDSRGNPVPTGWIGGGTCLARCILPQGYNSSTLWPERTLPRSNCPERAICFPSGTLNRGDLGLCLPECTANNDCRPGYTCRKTFQLGMGRSTTFMNGYCVPVNCAATGMGCPMGYSCRMTGTTAGICVSNGTGM